MKPLQIALGAGLALALAAGATGPSAAPKPAPASAARASRIDPAAVKALARMSAYLGTLTSFEIRTDTSIELVLDNGEKVTLDGVNHYLVHRPDGFMIEVATDKKVRQVFYNGKTLTVNAPKLGYYATVPAPPTIRQTLDEASDRYGIVLPLEDLFRWADPRNGETQRLHAASVVGTATIDGAECDQYAFREGDIDWQVWIQRGDKPVPRKVVIVDRTDLSHPEFAARLSWNTAPQLTANAFTYQPAAGAHAIRIAAK